MAPGISPSDDNGEYLVILSRESGPETLAMLAAQVRVTQVASPRVVIVETGPGEHPPASLPGVLAVTDGELKPLVAETLDETEMLFAAAWASRMTGPSKQRRGEGLSWARLAFFRPTPRPVDPNQPAIPN